jgi:hypothetical protein
MMFAEGKNSPALHRLRRQLVIANIQHALAAANLP